MLRSGARVEIEIEASERVVPQTNVLTGPDRLIVDFVNARPGAQLRNLPVNRAEVKNLRVGLFSSDPPVTRVVLDLNGPQPYQVFSSGKIVIVKIGESPGATSAVFQPAAGPVLVNANYPAPSAKPASPLGGKPRLVVSFEGGLLSISSNKANLSEILFEVHQRTGAEIAIPAGAEQEQVAAEIGPAPAPEVLAHLLNGSRFNFMILSSATNPQALDRVILSPRGEGAILPGNPQPQPAPDDDGEDVQSKVVPPAGAPAGPSIDNPTPTPPDTRPSDTDVPN